MVETKPEETEVYVEEDMAEVKLMSGGSPSIEGEVKNKESEESRSKSET